MPRCRLPVRSRCTRNCASGDKHASRGHRSRPLRALKDFRKSLKIFVRLLLIMRRGDASTSEPRDRDWHFDFESKLNVERDEAIPQAMRRAV